MQGIFIVLEGPDGAGTTKHSKLLADRLTREGSDVMLTFEPTDGPVGSAIRKDLYAHKAMDAAELQKRFCEDRSWHVEHVIRPALARGAVVISDRYRDSTVAYGNALGLDADMLEEMNEDFPQPDILFYLLPPFSVLQERMGKRESTDVLERTELQQKVYENYRLLAKENPKIIVIDTSGDLEAGAAVIFGHVKNHLSS
ncbi:MAG: dTMP kinase [Candidatus Peribacteraceae bacterium]|nr:dTMP kinase [Candidatus Peribacteraceae bacterium]MDD5074658.1 dTMP kinase [Candidatus Peribacteraceae bacterium]